MRDVVVLGGGPAGATAATLLAQQGHDVLVLEKERFPRAHVGESLLPAVVPVLERLGIDLGKAGFLIKRGAEFVDEATGGHVEFSFTEGRNYVEVDLDTGEVRHRFALSPFQLDGVLRRPGH